LLTALTASAYGGPGVAKTKNNILLSSSTDLGILFSSMSTVLLQLTESVFGEHRVLHLAERSDAHSVLCGDTEHVERSFIERRDGVLDLLDCGVHGLPAFTSDVTLLHHVVSDA